jgi:hypothetical protein
MSANGFFSKHPKKSRIGTGPNKNSRYLTTRTCNPRKQQTEVVPRYHSLENKQTVPAYHPL